MCSNKFWGLLALFSCTNEDLESLTTYTVSVDDLSSRLQDLFYFGDELTGYKSGREVYFQLSNQWETAITELVRNGKVNILDAAIFFFKNEQFDNAIFARVLVSRFTQALRVPETVINRIFEWDYNEKLLIQIENDYPSSIVLELYKAELEIDNDNVTMSFENPFTISSHPGELKRAPFVQTLYSGSAIQEIILLTDFDIDEYYPRESDELATTSLNNSIHDLNVIFYGPPGTGKTYHLKNSYFDQFSTKESSLTEDQNFINVAQDLSWWQSIALALLDKNHVKVSELMENRWLKEKIKNTNSKNVRATIWGNLQTHTIESSETVNVKGRQAPNIFDKSENSIWQVNKEEIENHAPELFDIKDSVDNFKPTADKEIKRYVFTTFHQAFTYEDFIEGIKPVMDEGESDNLDYKIIDGVFKRIARRAEQDLDNAYAIFIDEINRGNIAQIFGELITLIEGDKRSGMPDALEVTLPYSKQKFSVPPNLSIIGTMNTADRSVEALDTALRRRFSFKEMMPDPTLLKDISWNEIAIAEVLEKINQRIEVLVDRDHTIGHSYFLKLRNSVDKEADLRQIFRDKIIPLLQEYFFNDYGKIQLVLGEGFVQRKHIQNFDFAISDSEIETSDYRDKAIYQIQDPENLESALQILLGNDKSESENE
jgi:hypothetical protein